MSRFSSRVVVLGLGVALVAVLSRPALAIKQFQDEFKSLYVKEGSPLAAEVERVKCNVCHVGKEKKERNAYGKALDERLDKKADKADKEKIRKALEEVIDSRLAELDRASADAVHRAIGVTAIGLWGATSAAAISLAVAALRQVDEPARGRIRAAAIAKVSAFEQDGTIRVPGVARCIVGSKTDAGA